MTHIEMCHQYWLVVSPPLNNISQIDDFSQHVEKQKMYKHVPNHQPDYIDMRCDWGLCIFQNQNQLPKIRIYHGHRVNPPGKTAAVALYADQTWFAGTSPNFKSMTLPYTTSMSIMSID